MLLLTRPITTLIVHPFHTLKPRGQPLSKRQNVPPLTPSHSSQPGSLPAPPLSSSSDALETTNHRAAAASCLGPWVGGSTEPRAQQSFLLQEPGSLCRVPLALTPIKRKDDSHLL